MQEFITKHKINNKWIKLNVYKDEHENIGIGYVDEADEVNGSPWQYITDSEKVNIQQTFFCLDVERRITNA